MSDKHFCCHVCKDKLLKSLFFFIQEKRVCYSCFCSVGRNVNKIIMNLDDKTIDELDEKAKKFFDIMFWTVGNLLTDIIQKSVEFDKKERVELFQRIDSRIQALIEIVSENE